MSKVGAIEPASYAAFLIICAGVFAVGANAAHAQDRVQVSAIELQGNSIYSDGRLAALFADEIGTRMTLEELRSVASAIEDFYKNAGYQLVRVVVPEQRFADGRPVRMVVLEGRLSAIDVQNAQRYSADRVRKTLRNAGLRLGEPFRLKDLERALSLLNRRAGIETSASLARGEAQGATALTVNLDPQPIFSGAIEINNFGSENTGRYRILPSINLANPLGFGDELNVFGFHSLGDGDAYYGYLDYEMPINTHGTSVKGYISGGNVQVGRELRVLDIRGDTLGFGVGIIQDQVFSARTALSYHAWLEGSNLEQTILDTVVSEDRVRKLRLGVSLDQSNLRGRSLIDFDVHVGLGEALGGMDDESMLSSRAQAEADNDFTKLTLDLTRIQRLTERWLVIPRIIGQYAFDSVVSGEQWTIGGAYSVRGHPPSFYSGDSGYTATLETRYSLFGTDNDHQLIGQISHGQVFVEDPFFDQEDERDLSGASLGFQTRLFEPLVLRADIGMPIGGASEDDEYVYAQVRYEF